MADNFYLDKYSYHLIAVDWKGGIVYNSTGFFVKKPGRLFFITARHALTGWNAMQSVQTANYPDENEIILRIKNTDQIEPYNIDLRLYKKDASKININSDADIAIIELDITLEKKYKIYSIEEFILPEKKNNNDMMKIYGFTNSHPPGTHLREIIKDKPKEGSLQYLNPLKSNDSVYFEALTVEGIVTQGFSGSPVFSISGSTIYFNGVCIGGEPGNLKTPKLLIANAESISDIIEQKLSQNTKQDTEFPSTLKKWIAINGL